ncbi:hypothetical protein [Cytobacillus kochii]|uniref:hypothetical protein n=1 Tax=Cytobacillus kochii TaxID=859143 RepID=UPI00402AA745
MYPTRFNPSPICPYPYTYPIYCHPYPPIHILRSFPPVNPDQFIQSAKAMEVLMNSASKLLDKMAKSREYSYNIMTAAQESNQTKVNQLIESADLNNHPKVTYTPDGLTLNFQSAGDQSAHLSLKLKWTTMQM